jgi:FkbM family methyltransferase
MPPFISYAANREDVVLHRAFRDKPGGFFIDVGAHHPTACSVTKALSDRGWTGINVEPNPDLVRLFAAERPRDLTLAVAAGERPGRATMYLIPGQAQLSTLSRELADKYQASGREVVEHQVEIVTLSDLCERHAGGREIDLLVIDAEGVEREVILGADLPRWRPRVLLIEATDPGTNVPAHQGWETLVLDAGYRLALFDGINRYYARSDDPALYAALSVPVNTLDDYITAREWELEQVAHSYRRLGRPARWAAEGVQTVCDFLNRLTGRRNPSPPDPN